MTSSALVAEFVKRHAKFNKTGKQTERILKSEFLAKYGKRDDRSITKAEIIRIIETIAGRGAPSQARNALAALRKMFKLGREPRSSGTFALRPGEGTGEARQAQ